MKLHPKFARTSLLMSLSLMVAGSIGTQARAAEDWEAKYRELCKYDAGWCEKLKDNGDWTSPKADIVDVLRTSRPIIQAAAKLYGVDPRAIAGCILTENSLNLSLKHEAEAWVAKFMKNSDHSIFGKRFGTGIGQLHDDIAYNVEPRAAAMEKRPQLKSMGDVHQRMESIEGSIYYVAAILKDGQDVYKKYGFDITKDIGLLTTLYNLGQYEMRARDTKNSKRQPRINHFGFFVQHNEPLLASNVGMNAGATSAPIVADAPSEKAVRGSKDKGASRTLQLAAKAKTKATLLTAPLDVTNLPDLCDQSTAKKKIGQLPKGIPYRVIAQDVDCKLGKWSLVSGSDGTVGWIKNSVLESKSTQSTDHEDCKVEMDTQCSHSIKAAGISSLHAEKNGLYTLNLKKITDCNADDVADDSQDDAPGFKDLLTADEQQKLQESANSWYRSAHELPNDGPGKSQIKRIQDAIVSKQSIGYSLNTLNSWSASIFMTKSNYQKLTDFFSKPATADLEAQTADEIEKLIKSAPIFKKSSTDLVAGALNACSNVPENYKATLKFLKRFNANLMNIMAQGQYYYDSRNAANNLQSFCATEFPAPTPDATPSSSPSSSHAPGACAASSEPAGDKISKMIHETQKACAKLAQTDTELLQKAKQTLKLPGAEKLAEVRECGFDLQDASKNLKKLNTTGCVNDIYVDSATAFEFLATQKIDTIYKPASQDGQFIVTPKQKNSCATGGNAQ